MFTRKIRITKLQRKSSAASLGSKGRFLTGLCLVSVVGFFVSSAQAAPIVHGNFSGATVDFLQVQEESATDPAQGSAPGPGLFGAPTVGGDSLDFNPQNFSATASGANGTDTTDSNLQFTVMAKQGKAVKTLSILEAGDTTLSGFSNDAFTSVTTNVFIEILQVNGNTPVNINLPPQALTFTPSGGTYQLTVDGSGPSYNTAWTGNLLVDLGPFLSARQFASKVHVSLDNTLTALSQAGTTAFIQKKDADAISVSIDIDTNDIPEPTAALLALLGVAGVYGGRRRSV